MGVLVGTLGGVAVKKVEPEELRFLGVPIMAPPFAFFPFLILPVFVLQVVSLSVDISVLSIVPKVVALPLGHGPPLPLAVSIKSARLSRSVSTSPLFESEPV